MHGGKAGAPKGNQNALKHGRYTGEALAESKSVGELLRAARAALSELDGQSSKVEALMMAKQRDAALSDDDELPFGREERLEARVMRIAARGYDEIAERFGVDRHMAYRLVVAGGKELPADRWERGALIDQIMRQLPKPLTKQLRRIESKPLKRIKRKPLPLKSQK
jgi:hypothetical protein